MIFPNMSMTDQEDHPEAITIWPGETRESLPHSQKANPFSIASELNSCEGDVADELTTEQQIETSLGRAYAPISIL
jgi:hypothetical protein